MELADTRSKRLSPGLAAWMAAIGVGLVVLAAGAATDLSIGDECYHFRKAVQFYDAGARLTHDPDYGPTVPPGIPFYDGALWPGGLALLWGLTGKSVFVAQAYQAAWVVLLVGSAWAAGRALGGDRAGGWSLLAAATMPAFLSFGILLYVEVAMVALLAAAAALLLGRRPFWGGLLFGLAFLVKPTVLLLFPAFCLGVLLTGGRGWRAWLTALLLAGLGAALTVVPDLWWRQTHLGTIGVVYLGQSGGDATLPEAIRAMLREKGPETFYVPSTVFSPLDLVTYLGVPGLLGLALALARLRRPDWKLGGLWLVLGAFLAVHVALLPWTGMTEVRYAMPGFGLVAILAALGLMPMTRKRRWAAVLLLSVAIAQAAATVGWVAWARRVPQDLREAMAEVGRLPSARPPGFVVNPEPRLTLYSGKPILWSAINPGPFFFSWSPGKQWEMLDYYGVEYFVIPRGRIYDDAKLKHTGGFPESFVRRLPEMPYADAVPVLDRAGLLVYRVKPRRGSP